MHFISTWIICPLQELDQVSHNVIWRHVFLRLVSAFEAVALGIGYNPDLTSRRREELQTAIQSSTIALLIVSANFLASDFIAEYELLKILSRAQTGEVTVMTIIAAPCLLKDSVIQVFQLINSPSKPLSEMTTSEQERTFVKLAEAISQKLM